ncbi:hypothetical protein MICAF_2540004 [Microcystis aeruginosa PCC 9807]|uniref:Uncharacterized protein n=1 Tax=Microcystis aeruginosa PCC 9807 TaxID=1160283 RepID=I4H585_MICAE|nr:hypothetical protein MICAF_2540004 [Microcystis aeruginosa PCC 9807]
MPVVPKIDIVESVEDLKELMKQQKSSLAYAKVQGNRTSFCIKCNRQRLLNVITSRTS